MQNIKVQDVLKVLNDCYHYVQFETVNDTNNNNFNADATVITVLWLCSLKEKNRIAKNNLLHLILVYWQLENQDFSHLIYLLCVNIYLIYL